MEIIEKTMKKRKLAETVVEQLSFSIQSGKWKPGDKLPAERVLAEKLGVSRTVLREAVCTLVEQGILENKDGKTYVRRISFHEIITNISENFVFDENLIKEIMEVRLVLENYIVEKATENITLEEIEKIQSSIDDMKKMIENGKMNYDAEKAFHAGLAGAAGNNALACIYSLCENIVNGNNEEPVKAAKAMSLALTASKEHQAILNAIRMRNSEEAVRLMRHHTERSHQRIEE